MFNKLIVKTTPTLTKQYVLEIDLQHSLVTYLYEEETKQQSYPLQESQKTACLVLIDQINQINSLDYQGDITVDGYYWEFDLVDEEMMYEIEGSNQIDETILILLRQLETIFNVYLGSQEYPGEKS